jgi:hypothetical protein
MYLIEGWFARPLRAMRGTMIAHERELLNWIDVVAATRMTVASGPYDLPRRLSRTLPLS